MKGVLHLIEDDLEAKWDWDLFDHWRFVWGEIHEAV